MEKPKPGFYWARLKLPHYWPSVGSQPTVVRFCDEGGDQWFDVMNIDAVIELDNADEELVILGPIAPPPAEH